MKGGRGIDRGLGSRGIGGGLGGRGVGLGLAGVGNIGHVARVGISHVVPHGLDAAVGESHAVLALGRVTISLLVLVKVGAGVVIIDSIAVLE